MKKKTIVITETITRTTVTKTEIKKKGGKEPLSWVIKFVITILREILIYYLKQKYFPPQP